MSLQDPLCILRPSLFLLCVSFSFTTVAQVTSTFSSDDEGWKVADTNDANPQTVTYHATGGNPDGIPAATDVTITGSNFNTTAANNAVYFGGVKANVTSASATQLVVKVPAGAQYAPIIVFDKTTGLSASTVIPFLPRFNNNEDHSGQIIRASMGSAVSFDLDGTNGWPELGDIDGDGLLDLIAGEGSMTKFRCIPKCRRDRKHYYRRSLCTSVSLLCALCGSGFKRVLVQLKVAPDGAVYN